MTIEHVGWLIIGLSQGAFWMNFYWSRVFRRHSAWTSDQIQERRDALNELEKRTEHRYQELRRKLGVWERPS